MRAVASPPRSRTRMHRLPMPRAAGRLARVLAHAAALGALAAALHVPAAAGQDVRVSAAPASGTRTYPPELFGINWNWLDSGGGAIEFGEMIRDRSFRNQDDAVKRVWVERPDDAAGGRVRRETSGGAARAWGGKTYPGYLALRQRAAGRTCVAQVLQEALPAGARYVLHLSAAAPRGDATLTAYLGDAAAVPGAAGRSLRVSGGWSEQTLTLDPPAALVPSHLHLCVTSAGEVDVDEVRLSRAGGTPTVRDAVQGRVRELGIRSLRWPTGSDADYFDWREAVGPIAGRGENPSAFGALETPSLGLHEFLDYCERGGLVPLLMVNVREPPEHAAALVEYVLGAASTPMGALRARNGRSAPWQVRHFELGNEPIDVYGDGDSGGDTAKGYVRLARGVAAAMRAKAAALGRTLDLIGVTETTFANADWIRLVPILSRWNATVLGRPGGMLDFVDAVQGHFYAPFNWRADERELFEQAMAGGAALAATVRRLQQLYGPLPPFWLTEYAALVQKKKTLFGADILLERGKDHQAALVAADLLMTALREGYAGAYLFNLAQWGTWGVLGDPRDLRVRPTGYAFELLARLAGAQAVPVTVDGAASVTLAKGDGNAPAGTRYATVGAVAGTTPQGLYVVLLNRAYAGEARVTLDLPGATPGAAVEADQLGPYAPDAGNETRADAVTLRHARLTLDDARTVRLPPRTLIGILVPNPSKPAPRR